MISFLRSTIRACGIVLVGMIGAGIVAAAVHPWILDLLEYVFGVVPYEGAVRIFLALALGTFLMGWLAYAIDRGSRSQWILWNTVALASVAILAVFSLDRAHRLPEEMSWIRYTTAAFLLFAAVCALRIVWMYWRRGESRKFPVLWSILAFGMTFGAADELFQIHEGIGALIERLFHISHEFTDFITVFYAFVALVVVTVFARVSIEEYIPRYQRFVRFFFVGAFVYFLSTLFDTFDIRVYNALVALAARLEDGSHIFSDVWYILYAPRQLLNSIEEVLENVAAALFAGSFFLLIYEKERGLTEDEQTIRLPRFARLFSEVFLVACLVFVVASIDRARRFPLSPVRDDEKWSVTQIAGVRDGLFHADTLTFREPWGLLIANEAKGEVLRVHDGAVEHVPDPTRLLRDAGGIAATAESIYVSDGIAYTIARYTKKKGWETWIPKQDGIREPEALFVSGSYLYGVSEREQVIFRVHLGTKKIERMELQHPLFRAPEDIALHAGLNRFLVTDDTTGYVFALRFGGTPTVFASPNAGLKNPEGIAVAANGHVFVTDNGTRQIVEFAKDGSVVRRIAFHRMYRDLQGISVVGTGKDQVIYVVTADGFDSASFMPTSVWAIRAK